MSKTINQTKRYSKFAPFVFAVIIALETTILIVLSHNAKNFALFNPKGPIASGQLDLIIFSAVLMLAIAIPTLMLLYFFAWKYRESNEKATYDPDTRRGIFFLLTIWGIPVLTMLVFAFVMIPATHQLDPRQHISSAHKTLTIQVVAMRWKWVFLYPEQHIATINYVQIPTDTPVKFELSADEVPMSSFWIPNLGGQLYAMTGHVNTLNLMAEKPGDYPGSSAEINGAGFSGMKFVAHADSNENFDKWVEGVKSGPNILDSSEYAKLLKPSEYNQSTLYAITQTNLFDSLLLKYNGSHNHDHMRMEAQ